MESNFIPVFFLTNTSQKSLSPLRSLHKKQKGEGKGDKARTNKQVKNKPTKTTVRKTGRTLCVKGSWSIFREN